MTEIKKARKKRDTSQKRREILDGAVRVFTECGFDAASMDKIAETADVSKRTIYNHFPSKEVLFQAIVEDFLLQRDGIKPVQYASAKTLRAQLGEFARAELFLIDEPTRRGLSRLLTSVFLMDMDLGKTTRSRFEPHRAFVLWLKAAEEDGKLHCPSPALAARMFYGMVEGCLTYPGLFTDGESLKSAEPLLDEIISTFLSRYQR
jgi:TetR/AcrR family transcriptional regulator of autoinduction and epiphytic fitness